MLTEQGHGHIWGYGWRLFLTLMDLATERAKAAERAR